MIKEFRVDNFLSWVNLSFSPHDANLLIGLNNSGKTNLCKALLFLAGTANRPLNDAAFAWSIPIYGIKNFSLNKDTAEFMVRSELLVEDQPAEFIYELKIGVPSSYLPDAKLTVVREKLVVSAPGFEKVTLLENKRGRTRLLRQQDHLAGREERYETVSVSHEATMLQRLFDSENTRLANQFKQYLSRWQYYDLSPDALRRSDFAPQEVWLNSDGGNLASAIYQLKKGNERYYRRLLDYVREVEPDLDYINFVGGDREPQIYMNFQYRSGSELFARYASTGTLRFLALAYILLAQPKSSSRPLAIIEEPENGLHVSLLKPLLESVDDPSIRPQLLFTSHSPYFVDLFDDKLDAVFVAKRDGHISSLSNIDIDTAKQRLSDFSLGEQHFREMLT